MHEIFFVFYFIAVLYHVVKATTMNFVNFSQLMSTCYLSARVRDSCSWVWDSHSWICWLCESQDSLQLFSKWITVPQEQHWKKINTTQTPVISIVFQRSFFTKKTVLDVSCASRHKAVCWDCNEFYVEKTKRRLHDRKNQQFKALTVKAIHQPLLIM